MSSKQELITAIAEMLETNFPPFTDEHKKVLEASSEKALLDTFRRLQATVAEQRVAASPEIQRLHELRRQEREQFQTDQAFDKIFATKLPGNLSVVDNIANRQIILSWLNPGEDVITHDIFLEAIKNPNLLRQLTLGDYKDPAKKSERDTAQLAEDRKTFSNFTRSNGYSDNEAGFSLAQSVLGRGFDEYQLSQAVSSNALRLAAASQVELDQYRQEYAELRQEFLLHQATPQQLKQAARNESEQRHAQAQRNHVQQQIQTRQKAEAGQFPVLPEVNSEGTKLDGMFFKRLADTNIKLYKQFCSKYGFSQITDRLNQV